MAASDSSGGSYYSSANSAYPSWEKSLKYNYNNSSSDGGDSMNIGPEMVIGGIGSIVGGIGSAIGARNQAIASQNIARMNLESAERAGFQNLLAGQWGGTGREQFAQGLQRDAADYQQAFLDPRKSILNVEDFNRRAAAELGPFGRKLSQQEKSGEINTLLAGKFMPMFESASKPFSYGRAPGYTTGSLV
jgi:hypothetical protein